VDGHTQVYAVLGDPVDHTLSPPMQNAAFRAAGWNAVYVPLRVPRGRLDAALDGLHAARLRGLNLTLPHKERAFERILDRTAEAKEAGATNTLLWSEEGWKAHATDGIGFLGWVERVGIEVRRARVVLLGAGGAARSILPKLLGLGPAEVVVASRTEARAVSLASRAALARGAALADPAAAEGSRGNLLIRCLSIEEVGPDEARWWTSLEEGAAVLDLNYGARARPAREHARERGVRYEDGVELLVQQGGASFRFWTGLEPPLEVMREVALRSV